MREIKRAINRETMEKLKEVRAILDKLIKVLEFHEKRISVIEEKMMAAQFKKT